MALKSADHVKVINDILSADSWLADHAWTDFYSTIEDVKEVILPNRVRQTAGGFAVIEVASRDYVKTGRMLYPTRAGWDKEKQYHGPFAKSRFRRNSKKKINGYDVRDFSTPYLFVNALTYEKDGVIEKVEFYAYKGGQILRTEKLT